MQVMVIVDSYLATAAVASGLLRSPALVERWDDPSALEGFAVSGLAGHLAGNVFHVESFLDAPPLPEVEPTDAVRYYLDGNDPDTPADDPIKQRIRGRGEQRAEVGPVRLAEAVDGARSRLTERLAALDPSLNVTMFGRFVLPLDQCLLWGMLELVVHIDDLSVSLDVPAPVIPEEAAELVVVTLARIALGRRGAVPLVRVLARRERSTGLATAF
jgi:hypothetical protein